MPDVPYPQAPRPQSLGDLLGQVGAMQNLQRFQAEQEAGAAIARQQPPDVQAGMPTNPLATMPYIQGLATARQRIAESTQSEADVKQKALQEALAFISTASSKDEAWSRFTSWAANHGQPIYGSVAKTLLDQLNTIPEGGGPGVKTALTKMAIATMGPPTVQPTVTITDPVTLQPKLITPATAALAAAGGGGAMGAGASPENIQSGVESNKALEHVASYQENITPFLQAYRGMSKLDKLQKQMGPGSTLRNSWLTGLFSLSPQKAKEYGVKEEDITAFNETNKWLHNITLAVPGGQQNADRLAQAVAGSPNATMNNATIKDMLKTQIGLANMYQVARQRTLDLKQPGLYKRNFADQINNLDPRAFGYHFTSSENQKKIRDQVRKEGPEAQRKFERSFYLAEQEAKTGGLYHQPLPED